MDMTHSIGRVSIRDLMKSQLHYVERRVCGVASGTACVIRKASRTLEQYEKRQAPTIYQNASR